VYSKLNNINRNKIHDKLKLFIKKYYLKKLFKGGIITISLGLSLLLVFAVSEYFFHFNSLSRLFLFLSFSSILTFAFIRFFISPLLKVYGVTKSISNYEASKIIGKYFPEIQDRLTNLLQLENENENNALVLASINQKAEKIAPFEFKDAVSFHEVFKFGKWALIPILIAIFISSWNPNILSNGTKRIVQFNKNFAPENPFKFKITNENLSVIRYNDFKLQIEFTNDEVPNDVYLTDGENKFRFIKKRASIFEYEFRNVQKTIDFQIKTGEFLSPWYKLSLIEKPVINQLSLKLNFPSYTQKSNEEVKNSGDIIVPEGTEITWKIKSSFVNKIHFVTQDSIVYIPSSNNQNEYKTKVYKDLSYSVIPEGSNAILGNKMNYKIKVVQDEYPRIKVKAIHDSINPLMIFHSGIIADDYGFKKLTFNFNNKDTSGIRTISIPRNTFQHQFNYGLNIKDLGFEIGDEFSYYFEVFDNDGVNGSKSVKSQTEAFKAPSKKEIENLLAENKESIKDRLRENMIEAQNLQKEFQAIQKMMLEKQKMDWQDKARIQQFLGHQRNFENNIEKLQFENEKNNFQKEQLSPQEENLIRKQEQINELFDQLMNDDMKKLYDELEKLLDELNEDKTKETIEEINLSNEELEKELDRTLEMFKQMEFDEKLEKVINDLKDLSKKQNELGEESKENKEISNKELQEKQEELNKKFKDLQEEIQDLNQKNNELENKRNLENTIDQQNEINNDQQKSSEELGKNNKNKANKSQKKAAENMKKLADQMEQMQQQMQQQGQMEDINSLRQILENLISLSVEQEDLMQNIKKINRFDPQFAALATKQGNLKESAKLIEDSLLALSKRQIALKSIINKEIIDIKYNMDKSIDLLRERKNYQSAVKQQYVMTSANNLALLLDESLQQMQAQMQNNMVGSGSCSKPGGSSPKSGMPDIKQMQKQLSEQMKKMMKELQGGNMPGNQGNKKNKGLAKDLAKMSAQQNAIKEKLKKLHEQQKKQGNNGLGDMKNLLKDLENNEFDLLNKNITRETILRQEKIMNKLLKAENAMRERELEEKRKSNKGKSDFYRNPQDFTPYKSFELKEQEELKTIPSSFNLYYKRRISEYFNIFDE
tara:strand:- start:18072 stop:21401 length:3330 start_codon:yes stop_codon:yes gene_type:complete